MSWSLYASHAAWMASPDAVPVPCSEHSTVASPSLIITMDWNFAGSESASIPATALFIPQQIHVPPPSFQEFTSDFSEVSSADNAW